VGALVTHAHRAFGDPVDSVTDHVEHFLDQIGRPVSFAHPVHRPHIPNGLVSDFGIHAAPEVGFQVAEYEERLQRQREDQRRTMAALRQAKLRGAQGELVSRQQIIDRDESICYLCGHLVRPEDIHLDHIIPVSRGGAHTAENLRVTHAFCNLSKGANLIAV